MKYDEILKEMNDWQNSDLSVSAMQQAIEVNNHLRKCLILEMKKDKKKALKRYNEMSKYFSSVLYQKFRETTDLDDDIIKKIITILNKSFELEDIAVVDKTILVKEKSVHNFDRKSNFVMIPQEDLVEITNVTFTPKDEIFKNLLVFNLNNILRKFLSSSDDFITSFDNNILYEIPNLKIYFSMDIKVQEDNTIMHFLVQYQENIFTFDIKMRDGYLILLEEETPVWKLTNQEKSLQKKII